MKLTHHVFIICTAALLFAPSLIFGPCGVDLPTQNLWVRNFDAQLYAGDWYPRWLMELTAGYGSPVFFFYPPLTYYITALFDVLRWSGDFGYLQITASAFLSAVVAGYGFYLWMRREGASSDGALAGSLLYMASPVSICINFYQIMLFSSLWIYAWVPFVMLFARALARGELRMIPAFAIAVACLVFTNAPMTVVVGIMVAIIVVTGLHRKGYKRMLFGFAVGTLLAGGLTAIYWMPANEMQKFANLNLHWVNFVHWTHYDKTHISRSLLLLDYAALALFLGACYRKNHAAPKPALAMGITGLLLLLPFGDWVWTNMQPFVFIQTSDRLFLIPAVAVAWLAATSWPQTQKITVALIAASCVAAFIFGYKEHYSAETYARKEPLKYEMYKLSMDAYATYLPGKDAFSYFGSPARIKALSEDNPQIIPVTGDAKVDVLAWQPDHMVFHYTATQPSSIIIRRLFFPGLVAYGATYGLELDRVDNGLVQILLPPGDYEFGVDLMKLLPQETGEAVSFFTLCLTALLILLRLEQIKIARRRYRRQQRSGSPVPSPASHRTGN